MRRKTQVLDPGVLVHRNGGQVDWRKSFPRNTGESDTEWRGRLHSLRTAYSFQKACRDPEAKAQRYERAAEWKRRNVDKGRAYRAARYDNRRAKLLYNAAKGRAQQKGLAFTLSEKRVAQAIAAGTCEATGIPFEIHGARRSAFSPSLDRKDSDEGYTDTNTWVVCWAFNAGKSVGSLADFVFLAEAVAANSTRILDTAAAAYQKATEKHHGQPAHEAPDRRF